MTTLFGSSSTFAPMSNFDVNKKSAWLFGDEREDTSAAGSFTTSDASSDAPDAPLSEEESFLSAIDTFPATSTGGAISEECFACWGAELAGSASGCAPGFAPGKGHLKNKFCRNCTRHGVYIDARRVRAVDGDINDFPEFGNARGVGVWTTDPTGTSQWRLVNHTATCKGAALMVFYDAPPDSPALTPLPADLVVGGWVHLRLGLGTLIPRERRRRRSPRPPPSRSRARSRRRRRPSRPPRRLPPPRRRTTA